MMWLWMGVTVLAVVAVAGYAWSQEFVRVRVALKMAEWSMRLGGAAVLDYMDKVRLINTPTYGHRIYTSPDGRVLLIDPVTAESVTFSDQAGAVALPKRCVIQVTSFGQHPARAELTHHEAVLMSDSVRRYLKDSAAVSAGGAVPQSQR